MNWNLIWTPIGKTTGEFIFLFGDEPILTKQMRGKIINKTNDQYLTFVESTHKFTFEGFNEFIDEFEKGNEIKYSFDIWDGEDSFSYNNTDERLDITLVFYTSNLTFSIELTEKVRHQFATEFRKFLAHYLKFFENNNYTTHI